jgi:hypothetical protein
MRLIERRHAEDEQAQIGVFQPGHARGHGHQ